MRLMIPTGEPLETFKYSTQVIIIMINIAVSVSIIDQESKVGVWFCFMGLIK